MKQIMTVPLRQSLWPVMGKLAGFVSLAYLFSWLVWSPLILFSSYAKDHSYLKYLHLVGSLGPAFAAFVMAFLIGGVDRLRLILQRSVQWRVAFGWHVIAWFSPFLLLITAQWLARFWGVPVPIGSIGRSAEYPELPLWAYWGAVLIFYGFGEEIGWRGFLLPMLQSRLHPVAATLIVSVIWALWHWPLFLFSPGLSGLDIGGIIGWLMSLVTGAFLLTWLFNRSGGSVLITAGFHATMDVAFLGPSEVMMIVGALTTAAGVAALVMVATRFDDKICDHIDT